jgi:hypothetical protein
MTPVDVQRNGSINSKTVNGRRIMVALSSIHLTVDKDRSILRTKERLLSAWDYRLLSNPSLNDILLNLESGAINLDEALNHL